MVRSNALAGVLMVAVLALAACGDDSGSATDREATDPVTSGTPATPDPTDPTGDPGPTEDPEPSEEPAGTAAEGNLDFEPTSDGENVDPQGNPELMLADVRVGEHEGFDRLVLEFSGDGAPGWSVHYVDRPRQDGSGKPIRLAGDVFLDIHARGTVPRMAGMDDGEWDDYTGPSRLRPRGEAIEAVYIAEGPFEGDHQVLVGVNGTWDPFRVFALTSPPRLVVDVKAGS